MPNIRTTTAPLLVDEKEASALLSVCPATLRVWRCRKQGPPFRKFGKLVRYPLDELKAWALGRQNATEGV